MSRTKKSYKNSEFINSRDARPIRILSEYIEPETRLKAHHVKHAIVFYGSARIKPESEAKALLAKAATPEEKKQAEVWLKMSKYYTDCEALGKRLTAWTKKEHALENQFYLCTGGGPGIMEAGNKGASETDIELSIGLNISLPFEQDSNPFISDNLNFEFHYFFMRKLWFLALAEALVAFPGGFGTCDEVFEAVTLIQTQKIPPMPIILYGKEYWENLMNFDYFLEHQMISEDDLKLFEIVDSVDEAFTFITTHLNNMIDKGYL